MTFLISPILIGGSTHYCCSPTTGHTVLLLGGGATAIDDNTVDIETFGTIDFGICCLTDATITLTLTPASGDTTVEISGGSYIKVNGDIVYELDGIYAEDTYTYTLALDERICGNVISVYIDQPVTGTTVIFNISVY